MKKIVRNTLVLALAMLLCLGNLAVYGATVTLHSEGVVVETVEAVDGKVTLPAAPVAKSGMFIGWCGTVNGEKFLLPAGATLEGVTEDMTVTAATANFSTREGASLRLKDNDLGVRFTTDIGMADYDRLVEYAGTENIALGTFIVPRYHIKKSSSNFNLEYMASKGYTKYLDVPAYAFYETDAKNGVYTIAGSVNKVLDKNRSLDFSGRGYMRVTYTDGQEALFYASFNEKKTISSVYCVVFEQYGDRNANYPNLILAGKHGEYSTRSKYSLEELDLMKSLLDTVVAIDYDLTDPSYTYYLKKSLYYISPWVLTTQHDINRGLTHITISPKDTASIESLKGVVLSSRYRTLKTAEFVNGTLQFENDEWITVTPK